MAYTHSLEQKVMPAGKAELCVRQDFSGESEGAGLQQAIEIGATDFEITWACDVSEIQCVIIKADQDLTIKTNSSSEPDDTISLKANNPYIWYAGSYFTNKLTVDVTKLYITNASGVATVLYAELLTDPTPA